MLILVAAVVDAIRGGLTATRVLVIACLVVAALMVRRAPGRDPGLAAAAVKLSCVILTMGNRPAELDRAVESTAPLRAAGGVDMVVVGNGADLPPLPDGVTALRLPRTSGVAGGRNAGVDACNGDVVLFLDDDGWYPDRAWGSTSRPVRGRPGLAVLSFRVVDPEGGPVVRWHVPRLRAGDPGRSSVVTTFAGGACAIRRSAYLEAGGLPAAFFYAHEETDLAWRLLELGLPAGVRRGGPDVPPRRAERQARDLVPAGRAEPGAAGPPEPALAAGRRLPAGLAGDDVVRERSAGALRAWLAGFAEGWRMDPGGRQPISARTAWRMTGRAGPP